MKKTLGIAGITLAVLLLAASTVYAFANAPEAGSMGVWGYVASPRQAVLDIAPRQSGNAGELLVRQVAAPQDAWVVVHVDEDGMPGERVGLQHVSWGVSRDVRVKLDRKNAKVIVAVHADKGAPNTFDFDMENKTGSPDRPFFVNGKELAAKVTLE